MYQDSNEKRLGDLMRRIFPNTNSDYLVERFGLLVTKENISGKAALSVTTDTASGRNVYCISLSNSNTFKDNRWEIACAIGHLLLGHSDVFDPAKVSSPQAAAERHGAVIFARAFLLPTDKLLMRVVESLRLDSLSETFRLPELVIKDALLDLGFINFPDYEEAMEGISVTPNQSVQYIH